MARIDVDGLEIDYDLVGKDGDPAVVITPGGRFPRDSKGVPELAEALAAEGFQVLLWDRPNCGGSQITFEGISESLTQAEALVGLVKKLDLGPIAITGGSGGSRVSLIAAALAPENCSKLAIWWISGDPISLAQLAAYYCGESAAVANLFGMDAVAELDSWSLQVSRRPENADIIRRYDKDYFIEQMQKWSYAYAYSEESPVPGMDVADWAKLTMPSLVFRSGKSDLSHTRKTSEWVHELLPNSMMVEPPWSDNAWNEQSGSQGEPGRGIFDNWPQLAPQLIEFLRG